MDRNTLISLSIILIVFSIFILAFSCREQLGQQTLDQQQAIVDAGGATSEVHGQYLMCYALNPKEKQACIRHITGKYLPGGQQNNSHYITGYQYEAEKLGFIKFLHDNQADCDRLTVSPRFIEEAGAYLVTCRNGNNYFLRFNYDAKEWVLIK